MPNDSRSNNETIFTMEATPLKYGPGASEEAGWELKRMGVGRVMLTSDPGVVEAGITGRVRELIEAEGIEVEVWDRSRVEPTDDSFQAAADFAVDGDFDGFAAVGGGTSIDTAKVSDLIATHGGEIMDYVNAPVGRGKKPPGPLKPLLAIPTTAGTGAEATTVAILDIPEQRVKTARPKPESPDDRPPYQGANPIADMWSTKALEYGGKYLRRAVENGEDVEARGAMMLGASLAGVGFGSAGVHIPHACAYPIAGLKHEWQPPGYPEDHPFVPHGWSVIVTAPAAFRFTYEADPDRHHRVAELLSGEKVKKADEDTLPGVLIQLMRDVGAPKGVRELGYGEDDIGELVEGAMKQQRLLVGAPRDISEEDLANIIRESMENW
jgi:alcohol dehydrogenase class IV